MATAGGASWHRRGRLPFCEVTIIEMLVTSGVTVICAGGGGIPVIRRADGTLAGAEAVIDKDLASALLAKQLHADHLLLLTDVAGVYLDWGDAPTRLVEKVAPGMLDPRQFPPGSMGPKLQAANEFVAATGKLASIGRLEDVARMLKATAGTTIDTSVSELVLRSLPT